MELDLFDRGVDYRDYYRPGGGASRLTMRRLLLLVADLDPFASRFWTEAEEFGLWWELNEKKKDRFTTAERTLMDIAGGLAGEKHWRLRVRELVQAEIVKAEKRERILAGVRERERRRAIQPPQPPPDPRADLNTTSVEDLMTVGGVGAVLAGRIVARRPFERVEDLRDVRGVGPQRYALLAANFQVK